MNSRSRSFLYTVLLVVPYIWSFFTQSQLNDTFKLYIVCPVVLWVLFIAFLLDRGFSRRRQVAQCLSFFALLIFYFVVAATLENKGDGFVYAIKLIPALASVFSYIFIGYDIKRCAFVGYIYAAISFLIVFDFHLGGITGGWNENSIGMLSINGVFFLLLSIELNNRKHLLFKIVIVAIILYYIELTGCRSVIFGFVVFLIVRGIIFLSDRMTRRGYMFRCAVLMIVPYILMQAYLSLYRSSSRDALNKFFFEKTGKILFTERELIWNHIFNKDLSGAKFWFGTGKLHINAHNIIMDIWYSFGLVGLVLFVVFILYVLNKFYRHISDGTVKSCVSCFLALFISQTFECTFFGYLTVHYNILLYMFLATAFGRCLYLDDRMRSEQLRRLEEE